MTAATLTIADFLLARIAEDEAYLAEPWLEDDGPLHRNRMLAECEAKRRIVEIHSSTTPVAEKNTWEAGMCSGCNFDGYDGWASRDDECPTLCALAAVYADHPEFREEWQP